jgi:hypothetical protein
MSSAFKPYCPPAFGGRWILSNDDGIVGNRMPDGQTGILTWGTEEEAQQDADRLNRPVPAGSWAGWWRSR